jgi:hypothetical protein
MTSLIADRKRRSPFFARMAELLSGLDQSIAWYGAHRAWPANEPARIRAPRA